MPNTIHIALASDDNYFVGLLTTVWSIARNCSRPHQLIVNILDGGISPVNWNYLVSRLTPTKCTIRRLPINQDTFEGFQSFHGTGKMTYARLLLPDLLSDVTHVIYTDVDILWLADIAELWDSIDEDAIMHISPGGSPPEELKWFSDHNYKWEKDKPFCAGTVIMNLAKFRREKLQRRSATCRPNGYKCPYVRPHRQSPSRSSMAADIRRPGSTSPRRICHSLLRRRPVEERQPIPSHDNRPAPPLAPLSRRSPRRDDLVLSAPWKHNRTNCHRTALVHSRRQSLPGTNIPASRSDYERQRSQHSLP